MNDIIYYNSPRKAAKWQRRKQKLKKRPMSAFMEKYHKATLSRKEFNLTLKPRDKDCAIHRGIPERQRLLRVWCYENEGKHVYASTVLKPWQEFPNEIELSFIHVPEHCRNVRGFKLGNRVMSEICALADETNTHLVLMAHSLEPEIFPQAKLVDWYKSFGFYVHTVRAHGSIMVRHPLDLSRSRASSFRRSFG